MRLVAVTRVMNEADIIEAMARHHAAFVDHHVFLDNGSTDRTLDILQALAAEGLALTLLRNTASVYADRQFNTTLYHWAVQRLAADWVLFVDADEFLVARGIPDIRAYLSAFVREPAGIGLELIDYEAPTLATAQDINVARRLVRRRPQGSGWWKVFVNSPLEPGNVTIAAGNHHVFLDGVQRDARRQHGLSLAHFSNRSPYQWAAKAVAGRLKVLAAGQAETPSTSSHYNGPFHALRQDPSMWLRDALADAARMQTDPALVEDPIPYLGQELLYTEAVDYAARALSLTLGVVERMAAKFGALLDAFPEARARIDSELAGMEALPAAAAPAGYGAVLGTGWRHPADTGFAALMEAGWSAAEPWGMWGIGLVHRLRLFPATSGIIECDVSAYIPPSRDRQDVAVFAGAELLSAWVFTRDANRGLRRLKVPGRCVTVLEFRPSYAVVPAAEDMGNTDRRELGMALYRLRERQ
jgi:glycosyltransferase involved in cell wall biosynthesis